MLDSPISIDSHFFYLEFSNLRTTPSFTFFFLGHYAFCVYWIRILNNFKIFFYKKNLVIFNQNFLNDINKYFDVQPRLLKLFKKCNKIWWYLIRIFYNLKKIFWYLKIYEFWKILSDFLVKKNIFQMISQKFFRFC